VTRLDKPIRLSGHARDQLVFRGGTVQEAIESVRMEPWQAAERGRLECRKEFMFNAVWNRRYYATKCVRPIFVEELDEIVVVTVYVHYF
jgi:hypothetical protein